MPRPLSTRPFVSHTVNPRAFHCDLPPSKRPRWARMRDSRRIVSTGSDSSVGSDTDAYSVQQQLVVDSDDEAGKRIVRDAQDDEAVGDLLTKVNHFRLTPSRECTPDMDVVEDALAMSPSPSPRRMIADDDRVEAMLERDVDMLESPLPEPKFDGLSARARGKKRARDEDTDADDEREIDGAVTSEPGPSRPRHKRTRIASVAIKPVIPVIAGGFDLFPNGNEPAQISKWVWTREVIPSHPYLDDPIALQTPPSLPRKVPVELLPGQRTRFPIRNKSARRSPTSLCPLRRKVGRKYRSMNRINRRETPGPNVLGQIIMGEFARRRTERHERREAVLAWNHFVGVQPVIESRERCVVEHGWMRRHYANLFPPPVAVMPIAPPAPVAQLPVVPPAPIAPVSHPVRALNSRDARRAAVQPMARPVARQLPTQRETSARRLNRIQSVLQQSRNASLQQERQRQEIAEARAWVDYRQAERRVALAAAASARMHADTTVRHVSNLFAEWDVDADDAEGELYEPSEADSTETSVSIRSDPPEYDGGEIVAPMPRRMPYPARLGAPPVRRPVSPVLPQYQAHRRTVLSPSPPPPYNAQSDRQHVFIDDDDEDRDVDVRVGLGRESSVGPSRPRRVMQEPAPHTASPRSRTRRTLPPRAITRSGTPEIIGAWPRALRTRTEMEDARTGPMYAETVAGLEQAQRDAAFRFLGAPRVRDGQADDELDPVMMSALIDRMEQLSQGAADSVPGSDSDGEDEVDSQLGGASEHGDDDDVAAGTGLLGSVRRFFGWN